MWKIFLCLLRHHNNFVLNEKHTTYAIRDTVYCKGKMIQILPLFSHKHFAIDLYLYRPHQTDRHMRTRNVIWMDNVWAINKFAKNTQAYQSKGRECPLRLLRPGDFKSFVSETSAKLPRTEVRTCFVYHEGYMNETVCPDI